MSALAPQLPLAAPAPVPRTPSVTVVCCVESGPLETTTLLMVESLRRWGGRFAEVPVIAVTPRAGPPLRHSTRGRLDQLGVRYLRRTITRRYAWYSFLNKPLSLVIAEAQVGTEVVVWLDADIFVTGAPEALDLGADVDFAGCPSDRNLGSTGGTDRYEPYWARMCRVQGVPPEALPWVHTCREGARIRLYFNGGVLAYRRASGYGAAYLEGCLRALDAQVRSRDAGLFFAEQVTAGLIAVQRGLRVGCLPESCNYAVGSKCEGYSAEAFAQARIVHYHDALWGHFFPQFLDLCRAAQPELYAWICARGPLTNSSPPLARVWSKMLQHLRGRRAAAFEAACAAC